MTARLDKGCWNKSRGEDLGGRALIILRTSAGLTRRRVLKLVPRYGREDSHRLLLSLVVELSEFSRLLLSLISNLRRVLL